MKASGNVVGVTTKNHVTLVPYESDPLEYAAETLITEFRSSLPVLTQVTILLPNMQTAPRLRELLLIKAKEAGFAVGEEYELRGKPDAA